MLRSRYSYYNKIFLGIYVQFIFIFIVYSKSTNLHSNIHFTDDAIVINTGNEVESVKEVTIGVRKKRQFESFLEPITVSCTTYHGRVGVCSSYRQCYQDYPDIFLYQGWLSGMQNTCSYYTPLGQQAYGVCCTSDQSSSSHPNEIQSFPPFWFGTPLFHPRPLPPSNWPPPIPTHPPNHTAPTHPPTHPAPITTPRPPSKPTTPRPPWVPSTQPTRPSRPTRPSTISVRPTNPTTEPDYNNSTECGIKNGYQDQERIVGGHNAEPGEWPWMAAILNNGKLFCGGSLIDNNHILTAAHCVAQMGPWDVARLRVNLGDHNIKNKMDVKHIERKVKKVVRHRGFDFQTLYNDVALLTLDSPVTFSSRIRPICLPHGKSLYTGRNATVTGWGSIREMGPAPGVLQEVNIPIWTNSDCKQKYGNAAPGGIIDTFLCAGKASKDSCSGDSGGPLMVNEDRWYQIGIVSWGIGCGKGQYPGVYTRITSFMPWINKNLNT